MSAPKPRIWWDTGLRMWREECACGYAGRAGSWSHLVAGATEHSRTHSAERVADQLERIAGLRDGDAVVALSHGYIETGWAGYGSADAFKVAADLVRTHLVKEAV